MQPRSNLIKSLCEIIYIYPRLLNFLLISTSFSNRQGSNNRIPTISFNYPYPIIKRSNQIILYIFLHREKFIERIKTTARFNWIEDKILAKNFAKRFQTHRASPPRFNNILIPSVSLQTQPTHSPLPSIPSSTLRYSDKSPATTVRKFRPRDNVRSHLISIIALPSSSLSSSSPTNHHDLFPCCTCCTCCDRKIAGIRGGREWKRQARCSRTRRVEFPHVPPSPSLFAFAYFPY